MESISNYLEIFGMMRGIGGDDSWGEPVHSQYEIDGKIPHTYFFVIHTIDEDE